RSFRRLRLRERLQRRPQIAFGVDQEGRGGDDFFSLTDAVEHLHVAVAAAAELNRARLEAAFAFRHQHHLPRAAINYGAGGDGDRWVPPPPRPEHDLCPPL